MRFQGFAKFRPGYLCFFAWARKARALKLKPKPVPTPAKAKIASIRVKQTNPGFVISSFNFRLFEKEREGEGEKESEGERERGRKRERERTFASWDEDSLWNRNLWKTNLLIWSRGKPSSLIISTGTNRSVWSFPTKVFGSAFASINFGCLIKMMYFQVVVVICKGWRER